MKYSIYMHTTTRNPIQNCHRTKHSMSGTNLSLLLNSATDYSSCLFAIPPSIYTILIKRLFWEVTAAHPHRAVPEEERFKGTRPLTPAFGDSHPPQPGTSSCTHWAEPCWLEWHCWNKAYRARFKVRGQRGIRRKGPGHAICTPKC